MGVLDKCTAVRTRALPSRRSPPKSAANSCPVLVAPTARAVSRSCNPRANTIKAASIRAFARDSEALSARNSASVTEESLPRSVPVARHAVNASTAAWTPATPSAHETRSVTATATVPVPSPVTPIDPTPFPVPTRNPTWMLQR
ncbi:hypothetical protein ATK17_0495 [Branchiibius hedensis]|uniref:Uncharacterized protein n=1 Tax=Branchiibius hedensis TaxID=672460 RepID=A0A2Y9BT05_9MICO|nr:hypothetical protein ATK17_0495 [Branchiibius hedensis]SSA33222.1 hypothetical protein SAMN04489750_0495 [Branchiibius hedensis]